MALPQLPVRLQHLLGHLRYPAVHWNSALPGIHHSSRPQVSMARRRHLFNNFMANAGSLPRSRPVDFGLTNPFMLGGSWQPVGLSQPYLNSGYLPPSFPRQTPPHPRTYSDLLVRLRAESHQINSTEGYRTMVDATGDSGLPCMRWPNGRNLGDRGSERN